MQLTEVGLANRSRWEAKGYHLPKYNRLEMIAKTKENPVWLHFGVGNIFRAFPANVVQNLLNAGVLDRGLIAVEGFDYEIISSISQPHDNYTLLVTLKTNGEVEKTVVGSIAEALVLDRRFGGSFGRLEEIFQQDSLQMASFTITEKGYSLRDGEGNFYDEVAFDLAAGPTLTRCYSYMGKVTSLLYTRYLSGEKPIAMVSMDNCSHNGDLFREAVSTFVKSWVEKGLVEAGFLEYIENPQKVSFPCTMIDKITPRPDTTVQKMLEADGIEALEPIVTSKKTYVAPFVNAEECEYLVIEDVFPNGRPKFEQGGLLFTDRETVDKVERMKVCTCLNPLHTALAIFGCLLGYELISEEMKDDTLRKLAEGIGYTEGLPVVVNPGILDPKEFIDTVLEVRIPNPFMPDTPQRIATDTSMKLAIRFGETIKAYQTSSDLNVSDLKLIPLVFAGWLRYLCGIDDKGDSFTLSPDPLLEELRPIMSAISLGADVPVAPILRPILENATIFGVNLYEADLGELVCEYFERMISGPGAVRTTLEQVVGDL